MEDKIRIVLAVLRGEISIAEAARREGVSQVSVSKWRDQFLAGDQRALAEGARHGPSGCERALAAEVEQLTSAPGEAHLELRLWRKGGLSTRVRHPRSGTGEGGDDGGEVLLPDRGSSLDVAAAAAGRLIVEGPVAQGSPGCIQVDAKAKADEWDAWGHRKIAELLGLDDDHAVSDSTVYRVLARYHWTLPAGCAGQVRQLARIRKEGFIAPPSRRNRLWQPDSSEFKTEAAGTWDLGSVVDYWTRVNLACAVTVTKATTDAITFLEAALAEVEALLGVTWIAHLTDPATGEIGTLRIVTDNEPCFKSAGFTRCVRSKRHLTHIPTRHKAPWTNGRSNGSSARSNKSGSTATTSATRSPSPPTAPTTGPSATRSDPTRRSARTDPSSSAGRPRPPNHQPTKLS